MPEPRHNSLRGTRVPGSASKAPAARPELREPEDVADPQAPRRTIDYSLQRRRALSSMVLAATGSSENLDPHPDLVRAAKFHGVPVERPCPWCRGKDLVELRFVYGDELGAYSGRLKTQSEIATMAFEFGEFRVYEVEVCRSCRWNHLTRSYVLGDGQPRAALKAPRDAV